MADRKPIPLEVQSLNEAGASGSHMGWYSKGHHAPVAFLAAIDAHEGTPQRLTVSKVQLTHWRCVPAIDDDGDPVVEFRPTTPGPGAFAVTVIEAERTAAGCVRCLWCNREQAAEATTCAGCGHNPGLPKIACGCARCLAPMANPARLELGVGARP